MQHFVEKLAVPILVASSAVGSMVVHWPYLIEANVQAVVPDWIDFAIEHIVAIGSIAAIELEHIVAIGIVPMVVRNLDLETSECCLILNYYFDTMIRTVNHMRLKQNNIDGVDMILVHICSFADNIAILWENP